VAGRDQISLSPPLSEPHRKRASSEEHHRKRPSDQGAPIKNPMAIPPSDASDQGCPQRRRSAAGQAVQRIWLQGVQVLFVCEKLASIRGSAVRCARACFRPDGHARSLSPGVAASPSRVGPEGRRRICCWVSPAGPVHRCRRFWTPPLHRSLIVGTLSCAAVACSRYGVDCRGLLIRADG